MQRVTLLAVIVALLTLTGCMTSDGPDEAVIETAISRVSTAIAVASTQEAGRYAASELAIAREKLASARQAASAGEYQTADRLISESLVNVQLAAAKADAARVQGEVERIGAAAPASQGGNEAATGSQR